MVVACLGVMFCLDFNGYTIIWHGISIEGFSAMEENVIEQLSHLSPCGFKQFVLGMSVMETYWLTNWLMNSILWE